MSIHRKVFYTLEKIGRVKYAISYHDGESTNDDGSARFDLKTFKSKKSFRREIDSLIEKGYVNLKSVQSFLK